jgi:hypothetical protein
VNPYPVHLCAILRLISADTSEASQIVVCLVHLILRYSHDNANLVSDDLIRLDFDTKLVCTGRLSTSLESQYLNLESFTIYRENRFDMTSRSCEEICNFETLKVSPHLNLITTLPRFPFSHANNSLLANSATHCLNSVMYAVQAILKQFPANKTFPIPSSKSRFKADLLVLITTIAGCFTKHGPKCQTPIQYPTTPMAPIRYKDNSKGARANVDTSISTSVPNASPIQRTIRGTNLNSASSISFGNVSDSATPPATKSVTVVMCIGRTRNYLGCRNRPHAGLTTCLALYRWNERGKREEREVRESNLKSDMRKRSLKLLKEILFVVG